MLRGPGAEKCQHLKAGKGGGEACQGEAAVLEKPRECVGLEAKGSLTQEGGCGGNQSPLNGQAKCRLDKAIGSSNTQLTGPSAEQRLSTDGRRVPAGVG